jgi:hypothetical protein
MLGSASTRHSYPNGIQRPTISTPCSGESCFRRDPVSSRRLPRRTSCAAR